METSGYAIFIYGTTFLKESIFLNSKPTEDELEDILRDKGAVKAIVVECTQFVLENNYTDKHGNLIAVDSSVVESK